VLLLLEGNLLINSLEGPVCTADRLRGDLSTLMARVNRRPVQCPAECAVQTCVKPGPT